MGCLQCGKCCGEDRKININLSAADVWRICSHLNISVDDFFKKYGGLKLFDDPRHPDVFDVELGLEIPCKFRKDGKCSVYKARPINCRIFPYWVLTTVPEDKLKKILGDYKCDYDLSKKEMYKKYEKAVSEVLIEESKFFEIDKQVSKDYKAEDVPVAEIKKAIALNLNKISKNSKKLEDAEKILK